jgi:hypothetical protein
LSNSLVDAGLLIDLSLLSKEKCSSNQFPFSNFNFTISEHALLQRFPFESFPFSIVHTNESLGGSVGSLLAIVC